MPPNTTGEARAYPRPLPDAERLGKLSEAIFAPDLPIVDPHHHLSDNPCGAWASENSISSPAQRRGFSG